MTNAWWAIARYAGTAALAGLLSAQHYYPNAYWIPIALAVLGVLGFHVVPTTPPMIKMSTPIQLTTPERTTPREKSSGILPDGTYPIPSKMSDPQS